MIDYARATVIRSAGRVVAAHIADRAHMTYVHVFWGAKRQFLELWAETLIKVSGHSARSLLDLSGNDLMSQKVTPHEKRAYLHQFPDWLGWGEKWRNRV